MKSSCGLDIITLSIQASSGIFNPICNVLEVYRANTGFVRYLTLFVMYLKHIGLMQPRQAFNPICNVLEAYRANTGLVRYLTLFVMS
jgi:hypothetical protein